MRAAPLLMFVIALQVPLLAAGPGDKGTPEFDKATALVTQLAHPRFAVREAAAKQLIEMGASAMAALSVGTKADDEEVRARSAARLAQAKAAELRRRADAYAADVTGKAKHDLPLLAEWEKLTGPPDAGSRKLFAEMVRNNANLFDAVAADPLAARL